MKKVFKFKFTLTAIIIMFLLHMLPFIGLDLISDFIGTYPKFVSISIMGIIVIASALIELSKSDSNNLTLSLGVRRWKHSILIFDDKSTELKIIMDTLRGYDFDIVTVRDVSDYRLAEEFEIIIGDIVGVGAGKDSVSVLNMIKKEYPYKIVYAMSSEASKDWGIKIDGEIISKEKRGEYPKKILERIQDAYKTLDNIDGHWDTVKASLENEAVPSDIILQHKIKYYSYVNSKI